MAKDIRDHLQEIVAANRNILDLASHALEQDDGSDPEFTRKLRHAFEDARSRMRGLELMIEGTRAPRLEERVPPEMREDVALALTSYAGLLGTAAGSPRQLYDAIDRMDADNLRMIVFALAALDCQPPDVQPEAR